MRVMVFWKGKVRSSSPFLPAASNGKVSARAQVWMWESVLLCSSEIGEFLQETADGGDVCLEGSELRKFIRLFWAPEVADYRHQCMEAAGAYRARILIFKLTIFQ